MAAREPSLLIKTSLAKAQPAPLAAMAGLSTWKGWPILAPCDVSTKLRIGGRTMAAMAEANSGMDIEVSQDQLALTNADAILCGHIHYPQQMGELIFYAGSIYMNNWGEDHRHGFWIHEVEAA